jgi:hypothetical protein
MLAPPLGALAGVIVAKMVEEPLPAEPTPEGVP